MGASTPEETQEIVQDDARERELCRLFNLRRGSGRAAADATLHIDGKDVPFELKSTTRGSVTTVRDFGPDHIAKWRGKHWLIGVYDRSQKLRYCLYGSPSDMEPWIREKEQYIAADIALSKFAPPLITKQVMYRVVGRKRVYSLKDAEAVQKRQYTAEEYRKLMDVPGGYSPTRMLEIVRERCAYVIKRGATLNNPHIPASYFGGWEQLRPGDTDRLQELVKSFLKAKA